MRLAADRIIAALRALRLAPATEEPAWAEAGRRLAAVQVDAAAAAAVPLEEAGEVYEEPKPKVGPQLGMSLGAWSFWGGRRRQAEVVCGGCLAWGWCMLLSDSRSS